MVGGTTMVSPHSDGREFSSGSGPQPHGQVATKAVLAHRSGELSLDNAFDLIEGHPHRRGAKKEQIPRGLRSARDDKQEEASQRGAEAPLYQTDRDVFHAFADAGKRLADLHVNYEQQPEYPLERVEKGQLNWRVEKMRLSKDKTTLIYNEFLTLKSIPPETYEYRLGNRSALEWVIDQYQVSTDKRSGIVNDPNRADDPEYILRLIGQVITVSLETMKIVKSLPALRIDPPPTLD